MKSIHSALRDNVYGTLAPPPDSAKARYSPPEISCTGLWNSSVRAEPVNSSYFPTPSMYRLLLRERKPAKVNPLSGKSVLLRWLLIIRPSHWEPKVRSRGNCDWLLGTPQFALIDRGRFRSLVGSIDGGWSDTAICCCNCAGASRTVT